MANANSPNNPYTPIIKDYIAFKLRSKKLEIPGYDREPSCLTEPCKTLRRVGEELEAHNKDLFNSMCEQLNITSNTAYPTFQGIVDEIFQSGINWGRIVAFVCFGANLAVYCAVRDELGTQYVDNIVNWVSRYMEVNLDSWLKAHEIWDGFVDFFKDRDAPEDGFRQGFVISTLAGLGLGALLMLTCK
eukprot:Seg339.3 transcript_id=Seg339.3/GoldUCD/mRNA.D3Y31 product="Bcl-2-like protein 1" protein_id=Seg339.3/GoldUCD/D3Y31